MKIQNMAVIFIIIILPISLILSSYIRKQVDTISLQTSYDSKLNNATYDALKAFQLNTINSDTSDLSNSKLRDIEASANTFFNSIASNFNMVGYNQDILSEYVPALVYTMYDGYYIYSSYTNKLDNKNKNTVISEKGEEETKSDAEILNSNNENATYHEGDTINGLKPYVYYSCRYKHGSNDFVITYSLDNYITIQGNINGEWVFDYGYLIDNIEVNENNVTYRGCQIDANEKLEEYIGPNEKYEYIKVNGVKYYKRTNADGTSSWFSILNGQEHQQENFDPKTTAAIEYYKEAAEFKNRLYNSYHLNELKTSNAVDENGNKLENIFGDSKVFDFGGMQDSDGSIEDPNSDFNQHRLAVIRYSIEKNLSIAIANYNNYSGATNNFLMPKLKEDEWDTIVNNVSIISFLQGLNIGGKIYNGYSIITNNKNEEVVNEDSIYILTNDNKYHSVNDNHLIENSNNIKKGVLNIDFERKSKTTNDGIYYFMPQKDNSNPITGCYESIVSQTNTNSVDNYYQYVAEANRKGATKFAEAYFTALGRERYGLYKTNHNPDKLKQKFGVTE